MEQMDEGLNTSITKIKECLLVTLASEMTKENIESVADLITGKAYGEDINGAIINFEMVSVLDSFMFNGFVAISNALSLMGVKVIWICLKPGVVSALMDLNVDLNIINIDTAVNLEEGMALLSCCQKGARSVL